MKQQIKLSLCEFQDGTFELYIEDVQGGGRIQLDGVSKLTPHQREVLERLMPSCVMTRYVEV